MELYKTLKNLLQRRLNAFPTTLEEDRNLLKNCEQTNLRNILIYRMGQKEILINAIAAIRKMEAQFSQSEYVINFVKKTNFEIKYKQLENSSIDNKLINLCDTKMVQLTDQCALLNLKPKTVRCPHVSLY